MSSGFSGQGIQSIIVGLGNPGSQYLLTPHNIGWMVVDTLARKYQVRLRAKTHFLAETIVVKNQSVMLLQPLTYMNLSGKAVKEALQYYQLTLDQLLVVHDDWDLSFLSMKFQKNRGAGGHNGLRSINQELASQNYARLRLGIEKGYGKAQDVLRTFTKEEQKQLPDFLCTCVSAIESFLQKGLEKTANHYNHIASQSKT